MGWLRSILRLRAGPRILFIDDFVPDPTIGTGTPRAKEILRALDAAGARVTMLWTQTRPVPGGAMSYDFVPVSVEIAMGDVGHFDQYIAAHLAEFHGVLVSRPHNMQSFLNALSKMPGPAATGAIIYDAESLFSARKILQLALAGTPLTAEEAARQVKQETDLAATADIVLAVNARGAAAFQAAGHPDVRVLGHAVTARPTARPFAERDGFLFVGPTYADDTPNTDSVVWFTNGVLPRLRSAMQRDITLTLVGAAPAPAIAAHANGQLVVVGAVPDLHEHYSRARVFVAPTRFAAGLPIKVHDAAAHGLPIVLTPVLMRDLGWTHEQEALVAETEEEFSDACLRLHDDEALWHRIRSNALARVVQDADRSSFDRTTAKLVSFIRKRSRRMERP